MLSVDRALCPQCLIEYRSVLVILGSYLMVTAGSNSVCRQIEALYQRGIHCRPPIHRGTRQVSGSSSGEVKSSAINLVRDLMVSFGPLKRSMLASALVTVPEAVVFSQYRMC